MRGTEHVEARKDSSAEAEATEASSKPSGIRRMAHILAAVLVIAVLPALLIAALVGSSVHTRCLSGFCSALLAPSSAELAGSPISRRGLESQPDSGRIPHTTGGG